MTVRNRLFHIIVLITACLLRAPSQVNAQQFDAQLHSTYDVHADALTHVTHSFTLTNTISTQYVTTYAFELAGTRINDLSITSSGKSIAFKQVKGRNTTTISFEFPDKVVGTGKSRKFEATYTTLDTATKIGTTMEVTIPRLADSSLFSQYQVTIQVPSTLGTPVATQPQLFTTSTQNEKTSLEFAQMGRDTGISVSFGKQQFAKIGLTYQLQNPGSTQGLIEVALPPDGMYQRVYYDKITPTPQSIRRDEDGNWLASFPVDANQKLAVTASLYAVTTAIPQENAQLLGRKPDARYLASQEFWPVNDPAISKLARPLKDAEEIYATVISTLHYDYSKPSERPVRLGATGALANPNSSLCTEFTDLFIVLARKKGIPARAVIGYAYSQNPDLRPLGIAGDILHTWPEYWDETNGSWIPVDPTWGQTTGGMDYFHHIDFNRIVFATHGLSSKEPLAAGMYTGEDEAKNITTQFVDSVPAYPDNYETDLHIKPRALLGLTDTYTISIKNASLHASYAVPVRISATNAAGTAEFEQKLTLIPLQEKQIPVQLPRKGLFSTGTSIITVNVGSQSFTHELTLKTTIRQYIPLLFITGVVVACLGIITVITRRLLVPRWKR